MHLGLAIYSEATLPSDYLRKSGHCKQLLGWSSPKLEKLSIVDATATETSLTYVPEHMCSNLTRLFGIVRWPWLSWLLLSGLFVHGNEFLAFLQRHKPTLENLSFSYIMLKSESWRIIFTQLRGGVLTSVDFLELYVRDTAKAILRFGTKYDQSWDSTRKALISYIIDEEPWQSEVLPAGSSMDAQDTNDHFC